MTSRGTCRKYFEISKFPFSRQYIGHETAQQTKAPKLGKPALKKGITGGVIAVVSGLIVNLMFYLTWVTILITDLGIAAVASVSGVQLETGTVNLSTPRYSLPADLLGYLHIPPYTFQLIRLVGALGIILGLLAIATSRAGLRTPTKIFGALALISFALLYYEINFLLQAFRAGAMYGAWVTLSFSESLGLGLGSGVGAVGLLASGIKMARV